MEAFSSLHWKKIKNLQRTVIQHTHSKNTQLGAIMVYNVATSLLSAQSDQDRRPGGPLVM